MHALTQLVQQFVLAQPDVKRVWVALSGGLDSSVLLHAVCRANLPQTLGVIHVNHQLSPFADEWQQWCEGFCDDLGVELRVFERVQVQAAGDGLEQAARGARYGVFEQTLDHQDLLLLGHHRQDQAETFLLRLARGAGVLGLGSMKSLRRLGKGRLGRPLLGLSKAALEEYAEAHQLSWIEDESNLSSAYDRNFLRHQILPRLTARWPSFVQQVAKASMLMQEHETVLRQYLAEDFQALQERKERLGFSIELQRLKSVSPAVRNALVRYWLSTFGCRSPGLRQFDALLELLNAASDRSPLLQWQDCDIRRFRQRLYCLPKNTLGSAVGYRQPLTFTGLQHLPDGSYLNGIQPGRTVAPVDDLQVVPAGQLSASYRAHPSARGHSQSIKKLMLEYELEPWLRSRIPCVVHGQALVAVVGLWLERDYAEALECQRPLPWAYSADLTKISKLQLPLDQGPACKTSLCD